jgi:catechol 2,3-dioxygenase-like lactoylglutathione lyase family enzyme
VLLRRGDDLVIPAGTIHTWTVSSDGPARGLAVASPSGFARLITEAGIPDDGSGAPPSTEMDMELFRRVCAELGDEILGPPGALPEEITMSKKEVTEVIGVHHVGLSARDPAALAEFYHDVLGLEVVGGSTSDASDLGATAFLRSQPDEHHDLALFANPVYQHTAFKVDSLAHLRTVYQRVLGRGVPVKMAFNHGVSVAFYFEDPEKHLIEVYWPTGVAWPQPYGDPIDLTLSEEALERKVRDLAAGGERQGVDGQTAWTGMSGVFARGSVSNPSHARSPLRASGPTAG